MEIKWLHRRQLRPAPMPRASRLVLVRDAGAFS